MLQIYGLKWDKLLLFTFDRVPPGLHNYLITDRTESRIVRRIKNVSRRQYQQKSAASEQAARPFVGSDKKGSEHLLPACLSPSLSASALSLLRLHPFWTLVTQPCPFPSFFSLRQDRGRNKADDVKSPTWRFCYDTILSNAHRMRKQVTCCTSVDSLQNA